jgi:hypothetical protein
MMLLRRGPSSKTRASTKAKSAVSTPGLAKAIPSISMHHHALVIHYLTRYTRDGYCGDENLLITEGSTTQDRLNWFKPYHKAAY